MKILLIILVLSSLSWAQEAPKKKELVNKDKLYELEYKKAGKKNGKQVAPIYHKVEERKTKEKQK